MLRGENMLDLLQHYPYILWLNGNEDNFRILDNLQMIARLLRYDAIIKCALFWELGL